MSDTSQTYTPEPADDEINLLDLLAVLWRRKKMIIVVTIVTMLLSVVFAVLSLMLPPNISFLPNVYSPAAHMLINEKTSGAASALSGSGLSGLASLAGINLGSSSTSYGELASFITSSNYFLDTLVDEFDLIERYKIKKYFRANSRKKLLKKISSNLDKDTGVFSLRFEDIDPAFASQVVNFAVEYLENRFQEIGLDRNQVKKENLEASIDRTYREILALQDKTAGLERSAISGGASIPSITLEANRLKLELEAQSTVYKQLKTEYELLKIEMNSESPIFQVLELAEVPDRKSGPSRGMICIILSMAGFFFALLAAFVQDAMQKIRQDKEAMAKFSGDKA